MGGADHRQIVGFSNGCETSFQVAELNRVINVFLSMGTDQEKFTRFQVQAVHDIRRLDPVPVMGQHLEHGRAGFDDPDRGESFLQQVFPGNGAVGQIDIADMVDDFPVDLFRYPLVKTAVAGFHVKYRNLATLGRVCGQAGVGVSQDQQGIGLHFGQDFIHFGNDCPHCLTGDVAELGVSLEIVRFSEAKVIKNQLQTVHVFRSNRQSSESASLIFPDEKIPSKASDDSIMLAVA